MPKWSILFVLLIFAPIFSAPTTVHVAITESDVQAMGGWPLNRKWYSLACQKLINNGAQKIYLDLAFPAADATHPESDELFWALISNHTNIYLQAHSVNLDNMDSLRILGNHSLPKSRFLMPFSEVMQIKSPLIQIDGRNPQSLPAWLDPNSVPDEIVAVNFPDTEFRSDYTFREVIHDQIVCQNNMVIIYLDYPGVTSYILNPETDQPVATTVLQFHASSMVQSKQYFYVWPPAILLLLFLAALAPLCLIYMNQHYALICGISFTLILFLELVLNLNYIYIYPILHVAVLAPLLLYSGLIAYKKTKYKMIGEGAAAKVSSANLPDQDKKFEIRKLKEKIGFYEHLMNQPKQSKNIKLPPYLLIHPASPLMKLLKKAEQIAKTDIPVMIFGESGTGKEQFAKFIHESSNRQSKKFITVNCAAFNENLVESELFGHEAGSFTGAGKRKIGRFEQSDGGTLFLDEIGETTPAFQTKLLRVLQEGIFERVGSAEPIQVSVRIIAATNKDIHEEIEQRKFREDLFFRLNGYSLTISPLRTRPLDVEFLFKSFLLKENPKIKISPAILDWVKNQTWPGNVRELQAAIKRAVLNAGIQNRFLLLPKDFELPHDSPKIKENEELLSKKILEALRDDGFQHRSVSHVAELLGLHRATITEYLRGCIIRLLLEQPENMEDLTRAIQGNAIVEDFEKLVSRISGYVKKINEKIDQGLQTDMNDQTVRKLYFRNLPVEFETDLIDLIKLLKSRKSFIK